MHVDIYDKWQFMVISNYLIKLNVLAGTQVVIGRSTWSILIYMYIFNMFNWR